MLLRQLRCARSGLVPGPNGFEFVKALKN